MAKQGPADGIGDAKQELQCISGIMIELGETAARGGEGVPAAWVIWLGKCLISALARAQE